MTKFAAYDDASIYAIGETPDAAIATARADAREPEATFNTARVSDELAAWIEENGWNGSARSFKVGRGWDAETATYSVPEIVDTTDDEAARLRCDVE